MLSSFLKLFRGKTQSRGVRLAINESVRKEDSRDDFGALYKYSLLRPKHICHWAWVRACGSRSDGGY